MTRRIFWGVVAGSCAAVLGAACGSGSKSDGDGSNGGSGTGTGTATGSNPGLNLDGGSTLGSDASFDACTGTAYEQELIGGPLDIYLIFDRTASMGEDCPYTAGREPRTDSKACYATYALPEYLTSVRPDAETRLAFQFMSLPGGSCDGSAYATPRVALTPLPLAPNHAIIQAITGENFAGGFGTEIEGALRGLVAFTEAHQTPGREIIGVLMTDGDPNGCNENVLALGRIISGHLAATGIRTFIIGMEGATSANLEAYGVAGGAEPHTDFCGDAPTPCHHWNVGNGSGDAIAAALTAIVGQAAPLPCEMPVVGLRPPDGEVVDFGKVNVKLTDRAGTETIMGQVRSEAECPSDTVAWYYDNQNSPTEIRLCKSACDLVTGAEAGSHVNVVLGCLDTVILR